MTEKARVSYIDIAKAIGIFIVILGHVASVGTPLKTFLYTFHMPLFFMLTGMTYKWPADGTWSSTKKRIARNTGILLVPYILFALIYSKLSFCNLAFIGYSSWHTLRMAGSLSSLWFLMALFMSHVYLLALFKVLPKKYVGNPILLIITALLFLAIGYLLPYGGKYGYPWMTNVAFVGAAFIFMGMLFRKLGDGYSKISTAWRWGILIVTVFLFIVMIPTNHPTPGYVLMADALYGNISLFTLTAILGSASVLLFSHVSDVLFSRISLLLWIGRNTLGIFLVHKFIVSNAHIVLMRLGVDYNNVAAACVIAVLVLAVSCLFVAAINKYLPFLFKYEINEQH